MMIMDCTLRDGANVVGDGFSEEMTRMILKGLVDSGIPIIEFGNAKGIGAYEISNAKKALTDREYLRIVQPFLGQAQLGMFLNAGRFSPVYVDLGAEAGLDFFRVGANAGDVDAARQSVEYVKAKGLKAFYAAMKAYILSPKDLAQEARALEDIGVDEITIMDSAGTMTPQDTHRYVDEVKSAVSIPVGFHSHNNMYLAIANCNEAAASGADIIDCGLLGMARSAGNIATEAAVANLARMGIETGVNLFTLLNFLDAHLLPAMEAYGYSPAVKPLDLVLGMSGCHSSYVKRFRKVAAEEDVDLYRLIIETSRVDQKNPSEECIRTVSNRIKESISHELIK